MSETLAFCDLHIHSPASSDHVVGSYHSILTEASARSLNVIAITDHTTFGGYEELRRLQLVDSDGWFRAPNGSAILVLPGIEICAAGGYSGVHVLGIFPPVQDLNAALLASLGITEGAMTDANGENAAVLVDQDVAGVVTAIQSAGGIAIAAHVTSTKGLCDEYNERQLARLMSRNLFDAYEVTKEKETETQRFLELMRGCGIDRCLISSSDAHRAVENKQAMDHPTGVGSNACGIHLKEVSFEGLWLALAEQSPISRFVFHHSEQITQFDALANMVNAGKGVATDWVEDLSHPSLVGEILASLANERGGRLIIGVAGNSTLTGVPASETHLLDAALQLPEPPLTADTSWVEVDGGQVVGVVSVDRAENPFAYFVNGRLHRRNDTGCYVVQQGAFRFVSSALCEALSDVPTFGDRSPDTILSDGLADGYKLSQLHAIFFARPVFDWSQRSHRSSLLESVLKAVRREKNVPQWAIEWCKELDPDGSITESIVIGFDFRFRKLQLPQDKMTKRVVDELRLDNLWPGSVAHEDDAAGYDSTWYNSPSVVQELTDSAVLLSGRADMEGRLTKAKRRLGQSIEKLWLNTIPDEAVKRHLIEKQPQVQVHKQYLLDYSLLTPGWTSPEMVNQASVLNMLPRWRVMLCLPEELVPHAFSAQAATDEVPPSVMVAPLPSINELLALLRSEEGAVSSQTLLTLGRSLKANGVPSDWIENGELTAALSRAIDNGGVMAAFALKVLAGLGHGDAQDLIMDRLLTSEEVDIRTDAFDALLLLPEGTPDVAKLTMQVGELLDLDIVQRQRLLVRLFALDPVTTIARCTQNLRANGFRATAEIRALSSAPTEVITENLMNVVLRIALSSDEAVADPDVLKCLCYIDKVLYQPLVQDRSTFRNDTQPT